MKIVHPTRTTENIKYFIRTLKRLARVIFWGFIIYLMVAFVIWAVPKVWSWATGR